MVLARRSTRGDNGFSMLELLIVLAIVGILAGLGFALLPRQGIAVNQGQRILTTAIQFARFEAIRQNRVVVVHFVEGATDVVVALHDAAGDTPLRTFALDPQGRGVVMKQPSDGAMSFNSRGIATTPTVRTLSLGIIGTASYDVALQISGQGAVGQ